VKRALPVLVLTVAGLIPVWRYEPPQQTTESASEAPEPAVVTTPSPSGTASSVQRVVVAGSTVATQKGDVQVEVTFDGERITAVRMLKQPDHPQTEGAVPVLIEETLQAQSADIDTVSGATLTSDGYKESLQAAIDAKGA
jgi:uncharacterized protein with FMN-binding domain